MSVEGQPYNFRGSGGGGGGAVTSVFTRTGAVVAAVGDYTTDQVENDSDVPGPTARDALNNLQAALPQVGMVQTDLFVARVWPTSGNLNVIVATSGAGFVYSGTSALALGANGLLTYTGPTRPALVQLSTSWDAPPNLDHGQLGIAHNADAIGVALFDASLNNLGFSEFKTPLTNNTGLCTVARLVTLASGDTVSGALGSSSAGAPDIGIDSFSLSVLLL